MGSNVYQLRAGLPAQRRVASLLPAATEWVFVLGRGNWLVGVSHECDFPPQVRSLPVLTSVNLDPEADSAEIDEQVRALSPEQRLYGIDREKLEQLAPDLAIVQEVCAACGISVQTLRAAFGGELPPSLEVVELGARSLAGIYADAKRLGEALGCAEHAAAVAREIEQAIERLRWRSQRARYRPRVLCLEWLEPPIVAGHWIPELVQVAGGDAVLVAAGQPSRRISWPEVEASQPEVVLLMPCGFPLERVLRELRHWQRPPVWWRLPAVETGRVYALESNAYLNRPGPRIRDSAYLLAGAIQPALFAASIPPGALARVEP
jgi:iron complex transport system substrate-binding protein